MNIISNILSFSEGTIYKGNHLFGDLLCLVCDGRVPLVTAHMFKYLDQHVK